MWLSWCCRSAPDFLIPLVIDHRYSEWAPANKFWILGTGGVAGDISMTIGA
jgi:hypothetical protein